MTGGVGLSGSVGSSTFPFGFSILVGGVGFSSEMDSFAFDVFPNGVKITGGDGSIFGGSIAGVGNFSCSIFDF
jgi:hypothetical protein